MHLVLPETEVDLRPQRLIGATGSHSLFTANDELWAVRFYSGDEMR